MARQAPTLEENHTPPPPRHFAIIMDGNGRWAKKRLLNRSKGHRQGAEAVREAVKGAVNTGVEYLTLYAFSSENWNRPADEVKDLMGLLKIYLSKEMKSLAKEGVRVKIIGCRDRLSPEIISKIDEAEKQDIPNIRLTLIIALSYGSREEIVAAARKLAGEAVAGTLSLDDISENAMDNALYTHDVPDPDLIIRTSGEQRLSNFLLWQAAYSEFLFIDTLWPDFTKKHFSDAVDQYLGLDRRYGIR
ncbi:MAG: isoprenyl transferase, partial [Kordiimonadaceae bacterium]|nr:isoprenyl transferase [Kordiimonadaceae bacterium]